MLDKNGIEIKTGQIVEISGAYFKNDNGLYFVDKAPGDPSWCGRDYSLKKISKKRKNQHSKKESLFLADRCVRKRSVETCGGE